MAEFVNHNGITNEGKAVIVALEKQIKAAGKDPAKLNSLPGYARDYAAHVTMLGTMTQEQWLRERPGAAEMVFERIEEAARDAEKPAAPGDKALDRKLAALEQKLLGQVRELLAEAAPKDDEADEAGDAPEDDEADEETEADEEEDESED